MKPVTIAFGVIPVFLYALVFRSASGELGIGRFLIGAMAAFVVYLFLLWTARRLSLFGMHRSTLFTLVGLAVICRAILLFGAHGTTFLSADEYRYVFDGDMVVHGYNPYTNPPDAFPLELPADSTIFNGIRSPEQPTVVPPLSVCLFALAYVVHPDSIYGMRLLSVLFELITLLSIVVLIAPRVKRHPHTSWSFLIYLFSPLVLVEFVMSSHVDIMAMPFFIFSLVYLRRNRAVTAGLMLGLAAMVKLFALFFAPVMLFYFAGKDRWRFLAALALTCVIFYLPFVLNGGMGVFAPLETAFTTWQFGGSLFPLLATIIGGTAARIISGLLFAAAVLWMAIPGRQVIPDVFMRLFVIFGAFVILTPVLFPWYLVWLLPLMVYYRNVPFLVLSGTVLLANYSLARLYQVGGGTGPWWIAVLEYAPFYVLLIRSALKQWEKRRPSRLAA